MNLLWFTCNGQEQFEFGWQLIFSVQSIREVNSSYSAVSMYLHSNQKLLQTIIIPQCFNVICTVCSSSEIRQVKLDLIPTLIQSHRHGTDERFHSSCALIVWSSEPSSHILIVQYLYFESEIFFQLHTCKLARSCLHFWWS